MRLLQNIVCRYDELVLEVMWGMKNLLHIVVPEEELELSDEDSKHRSKGLQIFLQNLNFDIKPDLVSSLVAFPDVIYSLICTMSFTL
jgi:nucleolar protein 58